MINIDYPPFMIEHRVIQKCQYLCDHLHNKWDLFLNENEKIKKLLIDLVNKQKPKKQEDNYNNNRIDKIDKIGEDMYIDTRVDLEVIEQKYNEFVDLYNKCVDNIMEAIEYVIKSDKLDELAELNKSYKLDAIYTEEEKKNISEKIQEIQQSNKYIKRKYLNLNPKKIKISQEVINIVDGIAEIIQEIIVDILDMFELKDYFKYDPFEQIMKNIKTSAVQFGGKSFEAVKKKVDIIASKLKTLLIPLEKSEILQNRTQYESVTKLIDGLDKLKTELETKMNVTYKQMSVDLNNNGISNNVFELFTNEIKSQSKNFTINFEYDVFDENKLEKIQEKINKFKKANETILLTLQKVRNVKYNDDRHTKIPYFSGDILFGEVTDELEIQNKYDEVLKKISVLEKQIEVLKKIAVILNPTEKIKDKEILIEKLNFNDMLTNFTEINNKYFLKKYKPTLNDIITLKQLNLTEIIADEKNKKIDELKNKLDKLKSSAIKKIEMHRKNYFQFDKIKSIYDELISGINNGVLDKEMTIFLKQIRSKFFNVIDIMTVPQRASTIIKSQSIKNQSNENRLIVESIKKHLKYTDVKSLTDALMSDLPNNINDIINNYVQQYTSISNEIKSTNDSISDIDEANKSIKSFEDAYDKCKNTEIFEYLLQNAENMELINNIEYVNKIKENINVEITKHLDLLSEKKVLDEQLEKYLPKKMDLIFLDSKIFIFLNKLLKLNKHIKNKITQINSFVQDDKKLKYIDVLTDHWYKKLSNQSGGEITNDKTIILQKLGEYNDMNNILLKKIIELSEEIKKFKYTFEEYVSINLIQLEHNLKILYCSFYVINVLTEIKNQEFKIPGSLDYETFKIIYEKIKKINKIKNKWFEIVIKRMVNFCIFIEDEFKSKQDLVILFADDSKIFVDLVTLYHLYTINL
jgi:hypothetical protein